MPEPILQIALPTPLRRCFDYLPAESGPDPIRGMRVEVEFSGQTLTGIVWGSSPHSQFDHSKLKRIGRVLDPSPCMPEELLDLCEWAAQYYMHPLGEVLQAALPPALRQDKTPEPEWKWALTTDAKGLSEDALARSPKQQEILRALLREDAISPEQCKQRGFSASALKALADKHLIEKRESARADSHDNTLQLLREAPKTLNAEQEVSVQSLRYHEFRPYLLEGATGSGKTEVYLQLCARVLQSGRQVLVLIPEIGLTPQTIARFKQRFAVPIAELHSNVSDGERAINWLAARDGIARIVIGTRLAALAALKNPGLIIVDEEHDNSYKQQDGLRYSARDLCIVRAKMNKIPVLLGSATPALESLHNALSGRYQHLHLRLRANAAVAPRIELLDLRGAELSGGLCARSLSDIDDSLRHGHQVLVFLNRRGYAPFVLCHQCGWVAGCQSCSASLTLHSHPRHLHCHHCDRRSALPKACPVCAHSPLELRGSGTEQSEEYLRQHFPATPVLRIDRDAIKSKGALQKALATLHSGQSCLIVGTQMLAKGHDLAKLNLVVVVDADQGLFSSDFRGLERMGQLLTQVAGRAGRADTPGRVLIQSHRPDHPSLQLLVEEGYPALARQLLQERQTGQMPPYWNLALFRAESKRADNAVELLQLLLNSWRRHFPPNPGLSAIGPMPCTIEKVQDRYRFQLLFKSKTRSELKPVLAALVDIAANSALGKRTRWSLDVDPVEV